MKTGMRTCALCALLALAIACCGVNAAAEGGNTVYSSSFIAGMDGWYARGAQQVYRTTQATLKVTGRESDWHSPGRNFELAAGVEYTLSAEILQDDADAAVFMISVAHSLNGVESYENLARGTAKKGEWTKIEGSWKAGKYDSYVLYVETTGSPQLSFEMRDFRLTAPLGAPTPQPTEPPMVIEEVKDVPSIKEAYAGVFDFGMAAGPRELNNFTLRNLLAQQCSILTPENELKPDSVLDVEASKKLAAEDETAVAVRLTAAKPLLTFASKNGIKVHGHVLVWHSQTPKAFFHEGYDVNRPYVSREVMLARLDNYIRLVMEGIERDYPGVVVSWDVVNEAIDDGTGWLRDSDWKKVVGDDFVNQAFRIARKYAPEGVKLYYNDYNTPETIKLRGIIRLLEEVMPDGTIDGYGFQMHYKTSYPSLLQINNALKKITALGLRIRVSELDIGVTKNTQSEFEAQALAYARIIKLLLSYSDSLEAVQVWGITDSNSWRRSEYPLLFSAKGYPKPAFWAVLDPDSVK
ncbi:MAG: endo-1,4-beta-xylanase [Clostridiales bacterium]|nr:endo-1,4-beta-xylanase [Clostridiales bacterium]